MMLAARCGIAVAILRFDRRAGTRLHAISAKVALQAAGEELGYPQLVLLVDHDGARSTLDNALSRVRAFGLTAAAARAIVGEVARGEGSGWQAHFEALGVKPSGLAVLAQYLDRGELGRQRAAYLG